MNTFLDTSVLVPAFYGDHTHHLASLDVFVRCKKEDSCCGAHSLAEVYATLTRLPGRYRVSGEQAMLFIGEIRQRLTIIALDEEDYAKILQTAASAGVVGGTIYDAILAGCALKASVQTIYTWNTRHYNQFGSEVVRRLRTPCPVIPQISNGSDSVGPA
jgi:predicted nucleic acid-binding protein